MLDNMSIEQIGESMGVPLTSFEKEVEDDDGNTMVTNCVDMRTVFVAMKHQGYGQRNRSYPCALPFLIRLIPWEVLW